jgi:hypothetical protein
MRYEDYVTSKFERDLLKMIADRRQQVLEQLGSGADINDMSRYSHWTGYVKCLTEVVEMMATVSDNLNK